MGVWRSLTFSLVVCVSYCTCLCLGLCGFVRVCVCLDLCSTSLLLYWNHIAMKANISFVFSICCTLLLHLSDNHARHTSLVADSHLSIYSHEDNNLPSCFCNQSGKPHYAHYIASAMHFPTHSACANHTEASLHPSHSSSSHPGLCHVQIWRCYFQSLHLKH